jgi:hypothetical protein
MNGISTEPTATSPVILHRAPYVDTDAGGRTRSSPRRSGAPATWSANAMIRAATAEIATSACRVYQGLAETRIPVPFVVDEGHGKLSTSIQE